MWVTSDEPIHVRAQSDQPTPLMAALLDPDDDSTLQQLPLTVDADGWQTGMFEPVRAGYYRVRVDGPTVTQPAEDAVAVAEATYALLQ